ncbi:MAG: T9SS type A sorting domain-containing protein [candidate division Zixibacteria bacterium]|nr:T9SS type A sorting domain-containing protein [candidate division Zixibacteria bacterium]
MKIRFTVISVLLPVILIMILVVTSDHALASDVNDNLKADFDAGNPVFDVEAFDTVFADDIESGNPGWTHSAVTGGYADDWEIRNHRNHTPGGSYAWKYGSSLIDGDYSVISDGGLVTPVITIPDSTSMTFWMWGEIEESSASIAWDGAMVEISVDGGAYAQIAPVGGYTHVTSGGYDHPWPANTPCWSGNIDWTYVEFDLSAFADNNIQIRFRFGSDNAVSYEGWYIDDVVIRGDSGIEPPDWSVVFTPLSTPIIVPQGGTFHFDIDVTNNTGSTQTQDCWIKMWLPTSQLWFYKKYDNVVFVPGTTSWLSTSQFVPWNAMLGDFTYIGYIGDYPSLINDSSYFDFTIVSSLGKGDYIGSEWKLNGWLEEGETPLPDRTQLIGNVPNPFNPYTQISYSLESIQHVNITIYNMMGQKVRTLVDDLRNTGYHTVEWNGADSYGNGVSSGIYFYRMITDNFTFTKKMSLLK